MADEPEEKDELGTSEAVSDRLADSFKEWFDLILVEGESDAKALRTIIQFKDFTGDREIVFTAARNWSAQLRRHFAERDLRTVFNFTDADLVTTANWDRLLGKLIQTKTQQVDLSVATVIVPDKKVTEGVLIKATSVVWAGVVEELEKHDWRNAHEIPPRIWEEIIAGAFVKAGFNEVILTPRSNDHGRDVIAIKHGVGSIKVLDSVKAYKPGHLVSKEEVHALMGVVALDPNASKGILTTTSDFAPRLLEDPRLAETVPTRIELMNGVTLRKWLNDLVKNRFF